MPILSQYFNNESKHRINDQGHTDVLEMLFTVSKGMRPDWSDLNGFSSCMVRPAGDSTAESIAHARACARTHSVCNLPCPCSTVSMGDAPMACQREGRSLGIIRSFGQPAVMTRSCIRSFVVRLIIIVKNIITGLAIYIPKV